MMLCDFNFACMMIQLCAKYRAALALLLLVVVSSLHYNNFTNLHYHILDNGQLITHAHPVQDSEKDHSHTAEELVWLEMITHPKFNNMTWGLDLSITLTHAIKSKPAIYQPAYHTIYAGNDLSLRAPPAL